MCLLLLCLTVACQSPQNGTSSNVGDKDVNDIIDLSVDTSQGEQKSEADEAPVENQASPDVQDDDRESFFGVWIDGAGYDSFAALGFLQTLAKSNLKPAFVVGTGMGCWVAMSWAKEANSNQAEWQTFKFNRWAGLEKSWLSKVGLHNSMTEFTNYVTKSLEAKSRKEFEVPFECPLLPKGSSYTLKAARGLSLATLLWRQLQIPSLGGDPEKSSTRWLSGAFSGMPNTKELKAFARLLIKDQGVNSYKDKKFLGWLILKTRREGDLVGKNEWMEKLLTRNSSYLQKQSNEGQFPWILLDLSDRDARSHLAIKEAVNRRTWMLKGRNHASRLLVNSDGSLIDTAQFWQLLHK